MYAVVLMASGLWNNGALTEFPAVLQKQAPEMRLLHSMEKRIQARERLVDAITAEGRAEVEELKLWKAKVAALWRGVAGELVAPWTRVFKTIGRGLEDG
jgi:hypothetical protein